MNIQIQDIGQSEFRKFLLDQKISSTEVAYPSSVKAQRSPIANKIFGFPWTEEVTVGPDYVLVKKQNWVEWDILAEPLASLIQEHFEMQKEEGITNFEENPALPEFKPAEALGQDPLAQKIQGILDREINPMVASHGGKVSLVDVTSDKVYVRLEGGCHGCSSSQATLKQGVEIAIKRAVPQIQDVIDVTDHTTGHNPYM